MLPKGGGPVVHTIQGYEVECSSRSDAVLNEIAEVHVSYSDGGDKWLFDKAFETLTGFTPSEIGLFRGPLDATQRISIGETKDSRDSDRAVPEPVQNVDPPPIRSSDRADGKYREQ